MTKPKPLPFSKILPFICILTAAGLLSVGLWPFNPFPGNEVTWLSSGKGVAFGDHGIIFSPAPILLAPHEPHGDLFCSLKIRLQPQVTYLDNSGTLLAFYTPENPSQFRLMQYRDELLIRRDYRDDKKHFKTVEIELEHVFLRDEPVFFTITSGPAGDVAYRNGVWAGASTRMGLSCADFSGQLLIGNSPVSDSPWQGKLLDLAIYNWELTPPQVLREYAEPNASNASQASPPPAHEHMIANYAFSEGSGKIIHSSAGSGPDLYIPTNFRILHKRFLILPWEETRDKLELRDIAINIAGFVPFGFLLFAYLSLHRQSKPAAILTILAGAAVSVTIEVLQTFIPSRTSGVMDILTNTFGTFLGVLLFGWPPIESYAKKLLLYRLPSEKTDR